MSETDLSPELRTAMQQRGIDIQMSLDLLKRINVGAYDHLKPIKIESIPAVDGDEIVDAGGDLTLTISWQNTA